MAQAIRKTASLKNIFVRKTKRETIAVFVTLLYLLFQIVRTFIYPMVPMILRPIHVASVSLLCFLYNPIKLEGASSLKKLAATAFDWFTFIAAPAAIIYHLTNYKRLITRINFLDAVTPMDKIICVSLVVMIIGGIWRTVGKPLGIFILIFIVYGVVSPYLPGILYYQGFDLDKFTSLMIMGNGGIYGPACSAAAGFLFWMMMFGSLFSGGAGGQVLIDIGLLAGAKSKDASAPAKAAVFSSCLFGMISGSATANVASTGVFTIPMMQKVGYTPEESAAIEAVASTGGQIMPPIMGTAAFLMADMLEINYLQIASAALVPGIIYYGAVFFMVHLLAKKRAGTSNGFEDVVLNPEPMVPRLFLLLPIVSLIGAMALGSTIQRAALYAILTVVVLNYIDFKKERRRTTLEMFDMVIVATKRTSSVGMPLCGCGIIIGIITMSGLASRLSMVITALGGDFMWVGLIITMIGCMLLGMALPTVAAYLTAYVLFIPTLTSLGIGILPANLFIFYFGIFAQITPPVCLASYTAAGIAHSNAWKTGWKAFSYSLCAFFAPFVFVYQPGILLIGTLWEIVSAILILTAGTFMLTIGLAGHFLTDISKVERGLFILSGILICLPETISDMIGFVLMIGLMAIQFTRYRKRKSQALPS